jgi:hypothetical protein
MTTTERLRKVGEWLRGMILPDDCPVPALAGRCPVCGDEHWAMKTPCERCLSLAADALERAGQVEDETPVDEEWLLSVGFEKRIGRDAPYYAVSLPRCRFMLSVAIDRSAWMVHEDVDAFPEAFLGGCEHYGARSQVLALCKALGINLPESPDKEMRKAQ